MRCPGFKGILNMEEKSARIMWTRDLALFDGKISEQALDIKAQKHNVCSYWIQRVFLCLVFAGATIWIVFCQPEAPFSFGFTS